MKINKILITAFIGMASINYVFASDSSVSSIPANERALMDALKSCAEGASNQGINTLSAIASHCSQEKADLDAALSESMSEYVINSVLN